MGAEDPFSLSLILLLFFSFTNLSIYLSSKTSIYYFSRFTSSTNFIYAFPPFNVEERTKGQTDFCSLQSITHNLDLNSLFKKKKCIFLLQIIDGSK